MEGAGAGVVHFEMTSSIYPKVFHYLFLAKMGQFANLNTR